MHPILLGVMEKIESGLIAGKYSRFVKLTPQVKKLLSKRLETVKNWRPREFSRKPTSIVKFKKFKATLSNSKFYVTVVRQFLQALSIH